MINIWGVYMKDNLIIISNMKKTILYLDKVVKNFPNNERILKDKICNSMYEILECMYMANEVSNYNRILYQKKIISKIKMIDFYLKISLDKKYISYKRYQKVCNHLFDNLKLIYGWIRYEKVS